MFIVRYELNIKFGQTLRDKCLNPRRLGLEDVTRFGALVSAREEPNCGLFRSCAPYKLRSSHLQLSCRSKKWTAPLKTPA